MTKQGLEKTLVVLLFVMVLVVFSFAERDSKKIERLYTTAQVLKKPSQQASALALKPRSKTSRDH